MQINIAARHGHLSQATQERITEKVEGIRRIFDRITGINVTVDLEHRVEHHESSWVELRVSLEHHDDLVAVCEADTALAALDGVIDKMEGQLRKHKERLKEHRAVSHKHIPPPEEV